ncbi:MAG: cupin domain-containing protein [Pseudomonadota bacterium]
MHITRNGSVPSKPGPSDYFTGQVRMDMEFNTQPPARLGGVRVTFEPGARTNWHTHPLGQTIIVTEGHGWARIEGETRVDLHPGDIITFPPETRHWHGATDTTAMTHIAIAENLDGRRVDWAEPVDDAEFLAP